MICIHVLNYSVRHIQISGFAPNFCERYKKILTKRQCTAIECANGRGIKVQYLRPKRNEIASLRRDSVDGVIQIRDRATGMAAMIVIKSID